MLPRRRVLCNIIAALFSFLIIMPIMMMAIDRQLPVILKSGTIAPSIIYANQALGETFTVTWTATKMRKFGDGLFDCQGTYIRRFTDAGGYVFDTKPSPIQSVTLLADKESGTFSKKLNLPPLLPGPGTYQIFTKYWCNPVQKYVFPITHTEAAIHFMVIPETQSAGQNQ